MVENALTHGLGKFTHGIIKINIFRYDDSFLIYEIANNGLQINIEEIQSLIHADSHELRGLAIRNINERIHLKFNISDGLTCYIKNEFSVFRIKQPLFDTVQYHFSKEGDVL